MQPHIGFLSSRRLIGAADVEIRICSHRPAHEPQEEAAPWCVSSPVEREPPSPDRRTMTPLVTPLQPQTSASSLIAAAGSALVTDVAEGARRTSGDRGSRDVTLRSFQQLEIPGGHLPTVSP